MEWPVIILGMVLLIGIGIAEYVYRQDDTGRRSSNYVYVAVLWWLFVPIAAYKSYMEIEEVPEDDEESESKSDEAREDASD